MSLDSFHLPPAPHQVVKKNGAAAGGTYSQPTCRASSGAQVASVLAARLDARRLFCTASDDRLDAAKPARAQADL
jgi:hypothetical protein